MSPLLSIFLHLHIYIGSSISGSNIPSEGLLKVPELLQEISCTGCAQPIRGQIVQCRKGHIYCRQVTPVVLNYEICSAL